MSEESKRNISTIKETTKLIQHTVESLKKIVDPLGDKELSIKIKKLKETSSDIVEHIEKRSK